MKVKVRLDVVPDVPSEVSRPLLKLLRECEKYYPSWVQTLVIQFITSAEGVSAAGGSFAQIITKPEYYTATLRILPRWLDEDGASRRYTIFHEIGHLYHAEAYRVAHQTISRLENSEAHRELLLDLLRDAFEKSAEDFALMLLRLKGRI